MKDFESKLRWGALLNGTSLNMKTLGVPQQPPLP